MKKVILTIAMTMFMSMCFAQSDFNFDVRRLADKLQLTTEQMESVEAINGNMIREIEDAGDLDGFEKIVNVRKAIHKDVRSMHRILSAEQFKEYVVLLFTTVRNNIYNEING